MLFHYFYTVDPAQQQKNHTRFFPQDEVRYQAREKLPMILALQNLGTVSCRSSSSVTIQSVTVCS